jgi:ATP-dependent Lhr-like helicase
MSGRRPRLALYIPEERLLLKPRPSESLYKYYFENLSMIPEERHYLVVDDAKDEPVGTLDEAFVAEYGEPGVKFIERGSPWQVLQVFKDRVYVRAEEDSSGAIPNWVGDEIPVPFEVSQEVGAMRRAVADAQRGRVMAEETIDQLKQEYPVSSTLLKRALREVREQAEGGWDMPTDRTITLEGWEGYIIISCALGLNINKTLSRLLGFLLTTRTGSGVGTSQDAYRIFLKTAADPRIVADILTGVDPAGTERLISSALERTGLFKRRLLHVAKRFGVIQKDADLSEVGMSQLMEGMRGSVIWKEAMKEVLYKDLDVEGTASAIQGIREGKYIVKVMEQALPLSPISRMGVKELSWKTDLVPADRLRRLLIESGKARLLNEARVAVCTNCFRYVETLKAKRFMEKVGCPECGSTKIGILDEDPLDVAQMAAEKAEMDKVSERFKGMYRSAIESGELIGRYGLPAALAQVSKGIPKPVMITLATSDVKDLDYFIDRVLAEERAALKSRFRARLH